MGSCRFEAQSKYRWPLLCYGFCLETLVLRAGTIGTGGCHQLVGVFRRLYRLHDKILISPFVTDVSEEITGINHQPKLGRMQLLRGPDGIYPGDWLRP